LVEKHVLDNGVTLICESIEHVKSVTIGVWVKTQPPKDWEKHNGIGHFIEHLVFKGTKKRSAREIALAIDRIGGVLNAWTDQEATTFFVKVLDRHFDIGIDVISDLIISPRFEEGDLNKERNVVLDEILKDASDPYTAAVDEYLKDAWPGHPSGLSALGTPETISAIGRETVLEYYRANYVGSNMVVACCGRIDAELFRSVASEYFGKVPAGDASSRDHLADLGPPEYVAARALHNREFDHINLCLGVKGLPYNTPHRYEHAVLDTLLGSGVSSRLFQEIREKHGICYSIGTFSVRRRDAGLFAIHSATGQNNIKKLIDLIMEQLRKLAQKGVTLEETNNAKEQLKGSLMLALESTSARMLRLAREHIYFGKVFSLDEVCAGVDAVTKESVDELARTLLSQSKVGITVVGKVEGNVLDQLDLSI